jgi:CheY-like chemotaxis protein
MIMNTLSNKSILLIDDDEDDCYLFEEAVSDIANDLKVKYTHGTDHLLQILESTKPSLIFIDLHLPRLNGIECLRLIRSYPGFENIPVICWSGFSNEKDITAAYLEGANHYFEKPYTLNDLVAELCKILHTNKILSKNASLSNLCKSPHCQLV